MPSERSSALQKLMGIGASMFRRGFNSSKCKTESKLATARIKLLRNRREAQVRQMRRDIAALLQSRQEDTARIRVEHVIREQNIMAANEIIELFCELIVLRLPIIAKQRECPADLKEGICSLIYAAPRCSDIPELQRIRDIFQKKYGKDFVSAAIDLRPESGVNRMLIEKLSVRKPNGEVKLKIMKEIAKEYQIKWDTTESELELLKPPEELLKGPCSFANAASMPLKPTPVRALHATDSNLREGSTMHFKDSASAARAAAESAERAASAAQAAAYLATQNSHQFDQTAGSDGSRHHSLNSTAPFVSNGPSVDPFAPKRVFNSQSFHGSNYVYKDEDTETADLDNKKILRRNSCAGLALHSDIRFDDSDGLDSDGDEKVGVGAPSSGTHRPPNRPPPLRPTHIDSYEGKALSDSPSPHPVAHVHPKLPDYEALAARFEALKSRKY